MIGSGMIFGLTVIQMLMISFLGMLVGFVGVILDLLTSRKLSFGLSLDGKKLSLEYLGESFAYNLSDGEAKVKVGLLNSEYVSSFSFKLSVYYTNDMGFEKGGFGGGGTSRSGDSGTIRLENQEEFVLENEDYNLNLSDEVKEINNKGVRRKRFALFLMLLGLAIGIIFFVFAA